jgi:cytochrome c
MPSTTPASSPATTEAPAAPSPANVRGTPEQNGALPLDPGAGAPPVDGMPSVSAAPPAVAPKAPATLHDVLVFSRTVGFRHDAIPAGIEAIRALGSANGFAVDQTEDPARFSDQGLAAFDVVVFLSTTMDVLDDTQQAAFERFIRAGGGWVGVHAASDTEYGWAWYGQLLGGSAYFKSHPAIQTVKVDVENAAHPSTAHLPATFQLEDELYNFRQNPRSSVNVLLRLDESSYAPGKDAMGSDHPIAWSHEFDGGRAWYTGLGHRIALYTDPRFTQHLLGGIRWAAGVAP